MTRRAFGLAALSISLLLLAGIAYADVTPPLGISPGCRAATPADNQQQANLGIPETYQICPGDQLYLGIGDNFDQWYAQIKSQSPCNKNTCTLSCRTRNTGAQVCGPTASRWNSIGCHPNNNTAIFPTVAHGFAAHIELLRRYCGERGRCTIASAIQMWAPASHGNDPGSYAAFVSRMAGVPANQVFNPNDITLIGRVAIAMSCMEAGSLPYSLDDLKQGLSMASGGPRMPVPANVGQLLQESLTGGYAANPAGAPVVAPYGSPYPQGAINPNGNYAPGGQNGTLPSSVAPSAAQNIAQGNQPLQNGQQSGVIAPAIRVQPSALLIVQPQTVRLGNPLVVSWSSVGMSVSNPCTLSIGQSVIVSSNATSKLLDTRQIGRGTATFTLSCTPQTGTTMPQTASATIQ